MTIEMKQEVIKAHIYGVSSKDIAEMNGIAESEVAEALADTEAVEEKHNYLNESGWIE